MAYAANYVDNKILGCFTESEVGNVFEYFKAESTPFPGYDFKVCVGNGESRYAKVLETVVYIVIDEDADGQAVESKWYIKKHRHYTA